LLFLMLVDFQQDKVTPQPLLIIILNKIFLLETNFSAVYVVHR